MGFKFNPFTGTLDLAGGGVTDHDDLTGLADDDHTGYALLAGRTGTNDFTGNLTATGSIGLGTTSPDYQLEGVGNTSSQIHLSTTDVDSGLYLTTAGAANAFLSGGAGWNGSAWIAKAANAVIIGGSSNTFSVFADTSLTAGNSFTPTAKFSINAAGTGLLNGRLTIDGVSDVEQLVVQAHSTQTSKLQVWEDSTGSDVAYMKGVGDLVITRRLFFRAAESPKHAIEHDGTKFEHIVNGSVRMTISAANNFFIGRTTANSGTTLNSSAYSVVGTGSSDVVVTLALAASQTGDLLRTQNSSGQRITSIDSGGKLQWADGAGGSNDTNLYRSATNTLKTDDTFDAVAYSVAGSAGADGSFTTVDGKTVTVTKGLITSIV